MNKFAIQIVSLLAACVILFIISRELIADHSIPEISNFIASSTQYAASSTGSTSDVSTTTSTDLSVPRIVSLRTPSSLIHAMIADTDSLRQQGLSDRVSLPADQGMLFVFDMPGEYGFWMKDMHFPLDMVWIDADKTVVSVTKNLSPDTYPSTFTSPKPVSYVLEINAGSADKLGLIPGAKIDFDLTKD